MVYRWVFIFFDAELYKKDVKEIVGVLSTGDVVDFKNPDNCDFNIVPTTS